MAFTSTVSGGGSDRHHDLFISFKNGSNVTIPFFNRQGDDMDTNKGDLWTFMLSDYNLHCLSYYDFKKLAIVQSNTDTWHIESVTSILKGNACKGPRYYPLTIDMEANRWIGPRYESFNLTAADSCRGRY